VKLANSIFHNRRFLLFSTGVSAAIQKTVAICHTWFTVAILTVSHSISFGCPVKPLQHIAAAAGACCWLLCARHVLSFQFQFLLHTASNESSFALSNHTLPPLFTLPRLTTTFLAMPRLKVYLLRLHPLKQTDRPRYDP